MQKEIPCPFCRLLPYCVATVEVVDLLLESSDEVAGDARLNSKTVDGIYMCENSIHKNLLKLIYHKAATIGI